MSIKRTLMGTFIAIFALGICAAPTFATNKMTDRMQMRSLSTISIGNLVGTVKGISSFIIVNGNYVEIYCDSVRRIQIFNNHFEDTQTCKIVSSADIPRRPSLSFFSSKGENCPVEGSDQCWYSDYVYATTQEYQLANWGTRIIKTDGTVTIVSFYNL